MTESSETNPLEIAGKYKNLSQPEKGIFIDFGYSIRNDKSGDYIQASEWADIEARGKGEEAKQIIEDSLTRLASETGMRVVHRSATENKAVIRLLEYAGYQKDERRKGQDFDTYSKTFYPEQLPRNS